MADVGDEELRVGPTAALLRRKQQNDYTGEEYIELKRKGPPQPNVEIKNISCEKAYSIVQVS